MNQVQKFAKTVGAEAVWDSWHIAMTVQGRDVPPERQNWATLPDRDKRLDEHIAQAVVYAFIVWLGEQEEETWQDQNKT